MNSEGTKEEQGEDCSSKDSHQRHSAAQLSEVGGREDAHWKVIHVAGPLSTAEKTMHMQLSNEVNALAPGKKAPSSCNVPPQHFTDKA